MSTSQQPPPSANVDPNKIILLLKGLAPLPRTLSDKADIESDLLLLKRKLRRTKLTKDEESIVTAFQAYLRRREENDALEWYRELKRIKARTSEKIKNTDLQKKFSQLKLPATVQMFCEPKLPLWVFLAGAVTGAAAVMAIFLIALWSQL